MTNCNHPYHRQMAEMWAYCDASDVDLRTEGAIEKMVSERLGKYAPLKNPASGPEQKSIPLEDKPANI